MKLYLDDIRNVGDEGMYEGSEIEDWTVVRTVKEFNELLLTMKVREVSLDHDLGQVPGTMIDLPNGYDAICQIEHLVRIGCIGCPNIHIHTANPSARKKMELARIAIYRWRDNGPEEDPLKEVIM